MLGKVKLCTGTLQTEIFGLPVGWCIVRTPRQGQAFDPPTHVVHGPVLAVALPTGLQVMQHARRAQALQQCLRGRLQRQSLGQAREQGQVDALGQQLALHRVCVRALCGGRVAPLQVAGWPVLAIVGGKAQVVRAQFPAFAPGACLHAPMQVAQRQGVRLRPPLGVQLGQLHIGRHAHWAALAYIHPGTQAATPARHLGTHQCQVRAPVGGVELWKVRVELARPALPGTRVQAEKWLAHLSHDTKAPTPTGWRTGIQAQCVVAPPVAQHDVHGLQCQCWRAVLLIQPLQAPAAHHDFCLSKQPIGQGAVVTLAGLQQQTSHPPLACGIARDVQAGRFDVQLLHPTAQHRARRYRQHHAWQLQRHLALGIEQFHLLQLHGGQQTFGAG